MLIPPQDPPPYCERLRLFFSLNVFLDYWGCFVRGETYFVKYLVKFDQKNAKEGRPKLDILKVRGLRERERERDLLSDKVVQL